MEFNVLDKLTILSFNLSILTALLAIFTNEFTSKLYSEVIKLAKLSLYRFVSPSNFSKAILLLVFKLVTFLFKESTVVFVTSVKEII